MRGLFSASLFVLFTLAAALDVRSETAPRGAAASAKAGAGFDGVISIGISMEAGSGDLFLSKSGDKAKLDLKLQVNPLPAPIQLGVLLDPRQPNVLFLVNDNLRTYSLIEAGAMASVSDTAFAGKYALKVLGKETLLGYECTHLTLTRNRELVDAWITQDFPDVYAVLKKLQEANPQFGQAAAFRALEEAGKSGLPMRCIVVRDGQRVTTEVRKIERKALPAALFTVPADYRKSDLTGAAGLQPTPEQVEEMKKIIQGALEGK
ncbi:MAG TPA: DUF4412 domain-containing protein [Fibrobacteria bacterium]|nr:DUF4412 domain-containing protein [Fibrobacteria bacterium]